VTAGHLLASKLPLMVGALLLLGSCAPAEVLPAGENVSLDPAAFFIGHSRGIGRLSKIIGSPQAVIVESVGRQDRQGRLLLDQRIRTGNKPVQTRRWIMVRTGANSFTGSLTDAKGPVSISASGPRAFIRYEMKNGIEVDQTLALQRDGKTILNRLTARRLGVRLAHLEETIRKLD